MKESFKILQQKEEAKVQHRVRNELMNQLIMQTEERKSTEEDLRNQSIPSKI
jgi:hypothetical protein